MIAPLAPGNFAKKLSKLRFSWTTITTCAIGEAFPPIAPRGVPFGSEGVPETQPPSASSIDNALGQTYNDARLIRVPSYSVSGGTPEGDSCMK